MNKKFDLEKDFWSTIQGIPCQIEVTSYSPGQRGDRPGMGPPMSYQDIEPPEPEELFYEVYDRKGYPAGWLEDKITEEDDENILQDFHNWRRQESQYA